MVRMTTALTVLAAMALAGCQRAPTTSPDEALLDSSDAVADAEPNEDPELFDDDEGDGEGDLEDASLAAADPNAEVISFDEMEANPGGTDIITVQPDRSKSGSMLTPDILSGPK